MAREKTHGHREKLFWKEGRSTVCPLHPVLTCLGVVGRWDTPLRPSSVPGGIRDGNATGGALEALGSEIMSALQEAWLTVLWVLNVLW